MQSKADLHLHTVHSDGVNSVCDMLEHVSLRTNLKVIAITDHDCIVGSKLAAKLAPHYGIEVIAGEEISTLQGHLFALFIDSTVPSHRALPETIKAIHAQGGLAIAPHPFDHSVPSIGESEFGAVLGKLGLEGVEGFTAEVYWPVYDYLDVWRRALHNEGLGASLLRWARSNLGQPSELAQT